MNGYLQVLEKACWFLLKFVNSARIADSLLGHCCINWDIQVEINHPSLISKSEITTILITSSFLFFSLFSLKKISSQV